MALEQRPTQQNSASNKKSDAFLNIQVKDKAGNLHKVRATIGLQKDRSKIERSLIETADANPDYEFEIVGTVNVVQPDDGENIEF